jgi:lipoprotein NlpI
MASRESIGVLVMTIVFVLLMGGMGTYLYVSYVVDNEPPEAQSASEHIAHGRDAMRRGDAGRAIEHFTSAIDLAPDSAAAYRARAEAYARFGDTRGAVLDYTSAIERGNTSAEVYLGRAKAHEADGDIDGAVADYGKMLEINPRNVEALRARGAMLRAAERYEEAKLDLARAAEVTPNDRGLDHALGWTSWGAGDYETAYDAFTRLVTGRGRMHDWFGRGVTTYHLDDLDLAVEDLEQAASVAGRGNDDYVRYYLFLTHLRRGEPEHARASLAAYLERHGRDRLGAWSWTIASFLTGRISEKEFLAKAAVGAGQLSAPEQECEAYFYAGTMRLLDGDDDTAREHFQRGVDTGLTNYYEYFSSRTELRRLAERPARTEG